MGEVLNAKQEFKKKQLLDNLKLIGLGIAEVAVCIGGAKLLEKIADANDVKVDLHTLYDAAKDGAKMTASTLSNTLFDLIEFTDGGSK